MITLSLLVGCGVFPGNEGAAGADDSDAPAALELIWQPSQSVEVQPMATDCRGDDEGLSFSGWFDEIFRPQSLELLSADSRPWVLWPLETWNTKDYEALQDGTLDHAILMLQAAPAPDKIMTDHHPVELSIWLVTVCAGSLPAPETPLELTASWGASLCEDEACTHGDEPDEVLSVAVEVTLW